MQEPQPLGRHLGDEKIDAGRVATGPGEAGDKTKPNRIFAVGEDDRNRRCCSFGRERACKVPIVAITATCRRTRSAISAGRRS